ncbi:MAG TPA: nucleotidyltransferase domain-containing protein [Candidatus Nanoarchaeia archaeon]|nr:nucleotidyltransferase domain-containing protein [Candidatus Nanoarchaeia archaeon]
MIIKVNDIELQALSLFTKGYNKELYIREVERLLRTSSRTALVTLDKLEKKGILESKTRGKIKVYTIRKTIISREYFLLAEQYKKILFLEKNHLIKEIIEKLDSILGKFSLIFGSYAKGTQKEDSDMDLFTIGKCDKDKIREISRRYGIEINIKSYPIEIFEKEINDDMLLKEVIENHVIIKDAEGFVGRVAKWIK